MATSVSATNADLDLGAITALARLISVGGHSLDRAFYDTTALDSTSTGRSVQASDFIDADTFKFSIAVDATNYGLLHANIKAAGAAAAFSLALTDSAGGTHTISNDTAFLTKCELQSVGIDGMLECNCEVKGVNALDWDYAVT